MRFGGFRPTKRVERCHGRKAVGLHFTEANVAKSKEIEDGVAVDFDEEGRLIGIEVLDVSRRFSLADIVNVNIENLPIEAVK